MSANNAVTSSVSNSGTSPNSASSPASISASVSAIAPIGSSVARIRCSSSSLTSTSIYGTGVSSPCSSACHSRSWPSSRWPVCRLTSTAPTHPTLFSEVASARRCCGGCVRQLRGCAWNWSARIVPKSTMRLRQPCPFPFVTAPPSRHRRAPPRRRAPTRRRRRPPRIARSRPACVPPVTVPGWRHIP